MKTALLLITFFYSFMSVAENIYVAPVQGTNVGKKEMNTLRELIKVRVQNEPNTNLVSDLKQSETYIQTQLIKFESYNLSMTKWAGDKKISTGQWSANNLKELEGTVGVAVKDIMGSKTGESVGSQTPQKSLGEQAREKNERTSFERVEANNQVMIGFGPAYFNNFDTSGAGLGFSAGYFWGINDNFDLGLQTDLAISTKQSDAYALNGKVITNYFFMIKDISPFVGAGFGYGWARINDSNAMITDDTAGGFGLSLQAGVKFFRTSTVNLAISGEYTNIFDDTTLGNPGIFMLKAVLYY